MTSIHISDDRQRGVALIVSMVMLVVITLIGVIAMNSSHLEWLMTNNSQSQSVAYRNATIALNDGLNAPLPSDISTLSLSDLSNATRWSDALKHLDTTLPVKPGDCTDSTDSTSICGYIVEYLGCSVFTLDMIPSDDPKDHCDDPAYLSVHTYRAWAYGGDSKGAARILQLIFRQRSGPMKGPIRKNWTEIL